MATDSQKRSQTQAIARLRPVRRSGAHQAFLASFAGLIALCALFMILCTGLSVGVSFWAAPGIALLSAILAVVCCIPYFAILMWLDRNEREPILLVLSAFAWGAVMATGISALFNDTFQAFSTAVLQDEGMAGMLTASISAPFIEETSKAAALLAIYLFFHRYFDNVLDGLFYGGMVGLGFACFENFLYYTTQGSVPEVLVLAILRGVLTAAGTHICFTAITGIGFGLFRVLRRGVWRWLLPPAAWMVAMLAHFSWNTFMPFFGNEGDSLGTTLLVSVPAAVVVLQWPFLIAVGVIAVWSSIHERAIIQKYLRDENGVDPLEVLRLVPWRRRLFHQLKLLFSGRVGQWWRQGTRNDRLIRLAFEKWHMDRETSTGPAQDGQAHAAEILTLREELSALKAGNSPS